ncbi:MAG: (2Fe-2S) ferredoxin domain-containing protein [Ignavibacteriaceae bacterium]|nr:(2Fe-2S) ferredoxin domain-containing protein [Ignavibacteriaceae bacterium]
MKRFDKHIFVCENKRPEGHPRGCCHDKNSVNLREELKAKIKSAGLNTTVRVNSAGCLDACEFGPVMVVYPEQTWYGNFSEADLDQIVSEHIIEGKVVERLTIKDPKFNR